MGLKRRAGRGQTFTVGLGTAGGDGPLQQCRGSTEKTALEKRLVWGGQGTGSWV